MGDGGNGGDDEDGDATLNGLDGAVDPEATATRTLLLFYVFVNVGAFFMIATTYTEKDVGYWLAFLEPGIIYFLLPILLALVYNRTKRSPPQGASQLTNAVKIIGTAIRKSGGQVWKKGFWDHARPSQLSAGGTTVSWTERDVEDVRRTIGK